MKIAIIGATGTIGSAVANALQGKHEVLRASRYSGARVDIQDPASVRAFFAATRHLDAVICCAGDARFGEVRTLTDGDFEHSLRSKLMGQVNVVRHALSALSDHGSITLTSGPLARYPMKGSAAIAMVDAALEGFVRAAALDAQGGIRINAVCPGWVRETMAKMGMDPSPGLAAADVARSYVAAVEGTMTGAILEPRDPSRTAQITPRTS